MFDLAAKKLADELKEKAEQSEVDAQVIDSIRAAVIRSKRSKDANSKAIDSLLKMLENGELAEHDEEQDREAA